MRPGVLLVACVLPACVDDPAPLDTLFVALAFDERLTEVDAGTLPPIIVRAFDEEDDTPYLPPLEVELVLRLDSGAEARTVGRASTNGGSVTFSDVTVQRRGRYRLIARAPGIGTAIGAPFDVLPVITHLVFTVEPSDVEAGAAISPAVVVATFDGAGELVTRTGVNIEIQRELDGLVAEDPPLSAATVAGEATFATITLPRLGFWRLRATAGEIAPAVSRDVLALEPTVYLEYYVLPPETVPAGRPFGFSVAAVDARGERLTSFDREVTVEARDASTALGGTISVRAQEGLAVFDGVSYPVPDAITLLCTSPRAGVARRPLVVVAPRMVRILSPAGLEPFEAADPSLSAGGDRLAYRVTGFIDHRAITMEGAGVRVRNLATGGDELASLTDGGLRADNWQLDPSISGDGAFVVWSSGATNLELPDLNGAISDAYLRDLVHGTTTRIGHDAAGAQLLDGSGTSLQAISHDGRYAVFTSPAATSSTVQIFVRDTVTEQAVPLLAAFNLEHAAISAYGDVIAFETHTALLPSDEGSSADIYTVERTTGALQHVSIALEPANGDSTAPFLSASGRYVLFGSTASNLVPFDTNDMSDVFVADRQTGMIERVSVGPDGRQAERASPTPRHEGARPGGISSDGRFVVFVASGSGLVDGDTNARTDAFVRDTWTGRTALVGFAPDGSLGDDHCESVTISEDGRTIALATQASSFAPDDTNHTSDIYVTENPLAE